MNNILKSYFSTADMIAETFGNTCEVVIHDLTKPKNSVIYVANNKVTGRIPGQSFEHLIKQVLLNKKFKNDKVANYIYEFNNKIIKSSSSLIRDEKNDVIGMICINIDTTPFSQSFELLKEFLPIQNDNISSQSSEEFEEINLIIDKLIDNIIGTNDTSTLNKKSNLEIIKFMDKKGVFLVKGALDKIAERMGVSRVTIYNYLDEIRNS